MSYPPRIALGVQERTPNLAKQAANAAATMNMGELGRVADLLSVWSKIKYA